VDITLLRLNKSLILLTLKKKSLILLIFSKKEILLVSFEQSRSFTSHFSHFFFTKVGALL
jgi:hypothetical protein